LRAAQKILPLVKAAHDFEETVLFPLLRNRTDQAGQLAATVERLRYEHWGDEEYALDVHHALREFARQRDKANVDSLAWMLRGFFDGMRRHLAFDRECLLPILRELAIAQSKTSR
jgi:hemerythrin-like domain-containing protein